MKVEIAQEQVGMRIDQVIAPLEAVGSRSSAERLIRDGAVLVNGEPAAKSYRVRRSDEIEVDDAFLKPAPAPTYASAGDLPILYQDDDLLVVDKPRGVVVHPAPGHRGVTLVEQLAASGVELAEGDEPQRPGVVHRLDKDTSGVLLLAKTRDALRTLQQALRERRVRREYLALVEGHLPSRAGRIEAPIGRDSRDPTRHSLDTDTPREAITHFVVGEILPEHMLLRVRLETGRTHQIRVHFQAIGHPVVGDPLYGHAGALGLDRQFLHAAQLTFPHPRTGEQISVTSALPEDLQQALSLARRA